MSDGQNNVEPSQQLALQLASLLGRDRIVNTEQFTSIIDQVSRARQMLDNIEQEARSRHSSYQSMVQQLRARVEQGAEAEQLLRRLGAQAQQSQQGQQIQQGPQAQQTAPLHDPVTVVRSAPAGGGYYFQQLSPQQAPYASSPTSTNTTGPSTLPQQQPTSYASPAQQSSTSFHHQSTSQTAQQYQRPPPPPRAAQWNTPLAPLYSRTPTPSAHTTGSNRQRDFKAYIQPHTSVQSQPQVAPQPAAQPYLPPPSRRPSQSPQVPPVAFPPLEPRSSSSRPTVFPSGVSAQAKNVNIPTAGTPQTTQSPTTPDPQGLMCTQEQLAGIAMEIHDLLQPKSREVLESVLKLVMREMHHRGKMELSQNDIQAVYNWPLDPRIAPEVTPLFHTIVKKLAPLHPIQSGPLLRLVLRAGSRPQAAPNMNVQQLESRPVTPSTGPSTTNKSNVPNGSVTDLPSSSAPPLMPPPAGTANGLHPTKYPQGFTQPASSTISPMPNTSTVPLSNGSEQPQALYGSPFVTATTATHPNAIHPVNLSTNRSASTVLNPPPSSQRSLPSTPTTGARDGPPTPNIKTLARDILRSLGHPTSSLTSASSLPSPSKPPDRQAAKDSQATAPPPNQQYREQEIIVIDDNSSVSSRPAAVDDRHTDRGSPSDISNEAPLPRPPSPPPRQPSPPRPTPPLVQHAPPTEPMPPPPVSVDHDVVEIQTPGAIQMAYEEVQEMLQSEAVPSTTIDELMELETSTAPPPVSSSPNVGSAASPPPRSRSSTPTEPVLAPRTPTPELPPAAGPSKEPLFLASSPASSSADVENQMVLENDEERSTADDFTPTGLLGFGGASLTASAINKGKGRALEVDSDEDDNSESGIRSFRSPRRPAKRQKVDHVLDSDSEVVETSEPEEVIYRRPPRRGYKVEVEVPPLSERFRRDQYALEGEGGSEQAVPSTVLSSSSHSDVEIMEGAEGDEIEESEDENQRQQRFDEERRAVKLSVSRLRKTRCQWEGCRAVLESAGRLAKHLQLHASEKISPPLICDWEDCKRRFSSQGKFADHLAHHSEEELACAYANCPVIALTPRELALHQNDRNHPGQGLKRAAGIYKPQLPQLSPLPRTLPAYKCIPIKLLPARMSREEHIWIGSKIAANITCYVHPGSRPNAAAPSRTSRRLADKVAEIERRAQEAGLDPTQAILHMNHGEYDAWLPDNSERGPRYCDNLPSSEVTEMLMKGLVIGAEYLAGDRRLPFEYEEEEEEEEEDELEGDADDEMHDVGEDAHEAGNESDQTIVISQDTEAAVIKDAEMPDVVMADEQQAEDEVRIEVLQPSSSASIPAPHGDQQNVDG